MRGGRKAYRALTPEERARTLAHFDDLWEAAAEARRGGFHHRELHEAIFAPARRMGVFVWPALAQRIAAEVRAAYPHSVDSRW